MIIRVMGKKSEEQGKGLRKLYGNKLFIYSFCKQFEQNKYILANLYQIDKNVQLSKKQEKGSANILEDINYLTGNRTKTK